MNDDDYDVTVRPEAGYLRISITGQNSLSRTLRLLQRIRTEAALNGATRVLVDAYEVLGVPSTIDKYVQGEAAARLPFKIAALLRPEFVDYFSETVARNRGADIRLFTDEDEARAWLLAE